MDFPERRIGVRALAQQKGARNHIVIVDDPAILVMNGFRRLPQPDLGTLLDNGNVLDAQRGSVLGVNDSVLDVVNVADQAYFANINLLKALLDEAAAGIHVVVGELLLDLSQAEAIRNQLIGVYAYLIFTRGASETGDVDHIGNGFEILLDHPVFDRLQFHHVVARIGALQRVPIELTDGAPIRAHLRGNAGRQRNLRKPLQHPLSVPGVRLFVIEYHLNERKPKEGEGAQGCDVGNAIHGNFNGNRDLLLDLLRGNPRPLSDDIHVVVCHVRVRFHWELVKGNRAPNEYQDRPRKDQEAIL